jgi:hypothetical protein
MKLTSNQVTKFLFASEGIGAVFVSIFIAAYLLGLPSTEVRHSEPIFRTALSIFGILFVILVLATLLLSFYIKKNRE